MLSQDKIQAPALAVCRNGSARSQSQNASKLHLHISTYDSQCVVEPPTSYACTAERDCKRLWSILESFGVIQDAFRPEISEYITQNVLNCICFTW